MSGPALSVAASGLLRALVARSGAPREQVILTEVRSVEWHSLTFDGERHTVSLKLVGQHAEAYARRLTDRLEDAEFAIPGLVVADIHLSERRDSRSAIAMTIEALTLVSD